MQLTATAESLPCGIFEWIDSRASIRMRMEVVEIALHRLCVFRKMGGGLGGTRTHIPPFTRRALFDRKVFQFSYEAIAEAGCYKHPASFFKQTRSCMCQRYNCLIKGPTDEP